VVVLYCCECAAHQTGADISDLDDSGQVPALRGTSRVDQIGTMVPAVPFRGGSIRTRGFYYAYGSVPTTMAAWWVGLPNRAVPVKIESVDGPLFEQGRWEGRSDVAAQLRAILDPDDLNHWNIEALLGEVARLKASGSVQVQPDPVKADKPDPVVAYYGVWPGKGSGHYVYNQHGQHRADALELLAFVSKHRPAGFYPWTIWEAGRWSDKGPQVEGVFHFWVGKDLTLITCWDRSGDSRGNSASAFLVDGVVSPAEALRLARKFYPAVFDRMERSGVSVRLGGGE
jgi:hypothetical protein